MSSEPSLTVEEWQAAQECAAGAGPAGLDALYRMAEAMTGLGRKGGGHPCCGARSTWHWPWCMEGPRDHSL